MTIQHPMLREHQQFKTKLVSSAIFVNAIVVPGSVVGNRAGTGKETRSTLGSSPVSALLFLLHTNSICSPLL